MSGTFAADWLALREPFDAAARSRALAADFLAALPKRPRLLDLGAGTGANARYLAGLAGGGIEWRLVDRDAGLLARADGRGMEPHRLDFASTPEALNLSAVDGLTAAALFDLVSESWFERLVARAKGLPLLFALTVDGRVTWRPADDADPSVMRAFGADMRRDKGFGPAMGGDAPRRMLAVLRNAGYRVTAAPASWRIGPADTAMLTAMIDQVATVAGAAAWRGRRHLALAAGTLHLEVGHMDILALPPAATRPRYAVDLP